MKLPPFTLYIDLLKLLPTLNDQWQLYPRPDRSIAQLERCAVRSQAVKRAPSKSGERCLVIRLQPAVVRCRFIFIFY